MQHAALVCVMDGPGHLRQQVHALPHRQTLHREAFGEISAADELHGEIRLPIEHSHFMHRDDVRVLQMRSQCCLRLEPLALPLGSEEHLPQHLQRHPPAQPGVFRFIHHADAARRDLPLYSVVSEGGR